MKLENIVFYFSLPSRIEILNPDGTNYSMFSFEGVANEIFQRENSIFVNSNGKITCYDFFGNNLWENTECTEISSNNNFLSFSQAGIYTLNSRLKVQEAREEYDYFITKDNHKEFIHFCPHFYDLILSFLDYRGNTLWREKIHDGGIELSPILIGNQRLIAPFSNDSGNGFKILDLERKVLDTLEENISQSSLAVKGDTIIFGNEVISEDAKRRYYLEFYNTKKLKRELQILLTEDLPVNPAGTYFKPNNTQRIFFRTSNDIKLVDLLNKKISSYQINNNGLYILENSIVIDQMSKLNKKEENEKISAYDFNMNLLWTYMAPKHMDCYCLYPFFDGILLCHHETLMKIKDGRVEWTNNLHSIPSRIASMV